MEATVVRAESRMLRWPWRLDGRVVWMWVLTVGLVLYLGLGGGGYDLVVRSDAGVIVWWIVLVGAVFGVLPAGRLSRAGWCAIALLGGFAVWTAIAASWSLSSGGSLAEVSRLACYLGVLVLALTTYGDRERALRHVVSAVATTVVALCGFALISRLAAGTFRGADATASFLPGAHTRLGWPLNYWNALAALVALGVPLLLAIATSARTLVAQAVAAAAIPLVVLCGYLTFSRGGAIALGAALFAFIVLAPDRIPKLATMLLCAVGSAALIAGAVHRHAIEQGLTNATAHHQGSTEIVGIVLVCGGVAVAQAGIALAGRHGTLPRLLRISPSRARALFAAAVVIALVAAALAHGPSRLAHAWHSFKQPTSAALHQDAIGRFGALSGNGRYTYWKTSLDALPGHLLGGFGPGSFQLVWLPRAPTLSYVRNAHSLYVETLVEVGIIGLVLLGGLLVLLLASAVRRVIASQLALRTQAAAVGAALIAFIVSAAFDWIWQVPVLPVAVLLLASAVLVPGRVERPPAGAGRAIAIRAGLALGALASLIAIGVPLATTNALRRSQTESSAGKTAAALADARSAVRLEGSAAAPRLQEALVLELRGDLAGAVELGRQAASDEPQNWQTWLVLSRLQAEAGNAREALSDYRRARSLNPRSLIFHQHVASPGT